MILDASVEVRGAVVYGSLTVMLVIMPVFRGYHPEFLGEYAAQQQSRRRMAGMGLIALLGIVVLRYSEFRAWRLVLYPIALVILGGLLSSTLMNLFLVPSLYRAFGRVKRRLIAADQ